MDEEDYLEYIEPIQDGDLVLYVYDASGGAEDIIMGYDSIKNFIEGYERGNNI